MSLFETNTALFHLSPGRGIRESVPEQLPDGYKLSSSEAGLLTLSVNGRYLHSRRDPLREAETTLSSFYEPKKNLVLFFGIGLGYQLLTFARDKELRVGKRDTSKITLVIFEDDPVILSLALSTVDFSPLACFSVYAFCAADGNDAVGRVSQVIGPESVKGIAAVQLPGLDRAAKTRATAVRDALLGWVEREYSDMLTRFHFESIWTRNIIMNARQLTRAADVTDFRNACSGPAVIAAGGPTLSRSFDALREHREGYTLIAVDTAYAPLVKAGIIPDFVVAVDAGFYNYLDFVFDTAPFPYLVAEVAAYPAILRLSRAKCIVFSRASQDERSLYGPLMRAAGGPLGTLACSNTVSSSAVDFAVHAGFETLVLAGHDLSYPDFETHCVHANAYEHCLAASSRLKPLASQAFDRIASRLLRDAAASYPPADFILSRQSSWYEDIPARYPSVTVRRITANALPMPSIASGDIDSIAVPGARAKTLASASSRFHPVVADAASIRMFFTDTAERLTHIISDLDLIRTELSGRTAADDAFTESLLARVQTVASRAAHELPFLAGANAYIMFSVNRREGDGAAVTASVIASELMKLAVFFKTRLLQELTRL
ncbi:MAG: motility associated factor glycosyltransferase family protein [Spirochaetes bacterium]|nr:motility associated factor glycosyltransferase family protein [Spirochaetota bacterium]